MATSYSDFTEKLSKLCAKHGVMLEGKLRILNPDRFVPNSQKIEFQEVIYWDRSPDRMGPFIVLDAEFKPHESVMIKSKAAHVFDRDMLLKDGVKCPVDGKTYTSRKKWNDTLKAHEMVEMGDQAPTTSNQDIKGDFNVQSELREAYQRHRG